MSYRWEPIYRCCMCGKTEPADFWYGVSTFCYKYLPEGWTGSSRKMGDCFCGECSRAIKELKRRSKEEK